VIADIVTPAEKRANLGDNFRVEARIITWQSDNTLKVSSGTLFRRGAQPAVFVLQDGKARLQSVKVGRSSGTETEIVDGLREGDELIIYPGDRINAGDRVKALKIGR
jgi:HlyD family secretion protein